MVFQIVKMTNMNIKTKPSIALSASGFVFDPITGESYSVNPIGAEILKMMEEGTDTVYVKDRILEKYDVDEATFEKDLYDFIGMLENFRIVQRHDETNV
jgi:hypothetical protein